jgi:hypothetical protein
MYSLKNNYIYIIFLWFFKVQWVHENEGVMFLMIPPTDVFAHYNNYVKGYSHMVVPLFELTKKDVAFYIILIIKMPLTC